ncbi:MAG: ABC transporter permease [Acidobacteriota bacterium]
MRWYRWLLYLYPASFRAEYERELGHVFADRRRQVSGPAAVAGLWAETLWDTSSNSLRAHGDLLRQDLQHARRAWSRSPAFALAAIVVTALGIGANTAVFSVTDHVLLRPLPFAEPERLVKLYERVPQYTRMELSPPNFRDWRDRSASFEAMAAYHQTSANLVEQGDPLHLAGAAITTELLSVLGVGPTIGRPFLPEDDGPGAPGTLLLSHALWQGAFGGDRSVLGRQVRLDDASYVILGVMPPEFSFPNRETDFWVPMEHSVVDSEDRNDNFLKVIARLAPGISLSEARSEMSTIAAQLETEHPVANRETGATVIELRGELSSQARQLLWALFGASACVLLIASSNLANLFLVRALQRRKELAVRLALGAGRQRLVRQLLTESFVLTVLGGLLGLLVAAATVPLLARLVPASLPIAEAVVLDVRVLSFALLLTLATAIGFGILPALRQTGRSTLAGLQEGARAGLGGRRQRARAALVVAQVAISVTLLAASGLLIRALWRVYDIDPGFRAEQVLSVRTPLPLSRYEATAQRSRFYDRVLGEVRALPGVEEAAYISFLPMVWRGGIWPVVIDGVDEDEAPATASLRFVTPGFFATLGIPLLEGRDVRDADTEEQPDIAVVSRSFAQRYWPGEDPLGRRFHFGFRERVIAGVVGDIRFRGLERRSEPQVYLPHAQVPDGGLIFYAPRNLVVRVADAPATSDFETGDPTLLAAAIRRIVQAADPELPVSDVRLLTDIVAAETAPRRTQIMVLAAFAGLALLLAGIGIHGLLSFTVSQRLPEMGLRQALGARRGHLLRMVLSEGAMLAAVGVGTGLAAAYAAGRGMEALLAGVEPADPATLAVAVALALAMTLSGSLVPALRAARTDPTIALRSE